MDKENMELEKGTNNVDLKAVLYKEIDLIQNVINRMANNSFLIKGWSITLISAIILLTITPAERFLSLLPLIGFWFLDSYFLRQERLYRKLYEWVIANRLNSSQYLFSLNATRFNSDVPTFFKTLISKTLLLFYFSLFLGIIIISLLQLIT